jgi:hypothetical protein
MSEVVNGVRTPEAVELQILSEVGSGQSMRQVAKTHNCDHSTISAIMARYGVMSGEATSNMLKLTGNVAMRVGLRIWDHLAQLQHEDLKRINPAQLTVMAGIATDKANQLLSKTEGPGAPDWSKLMVQPDNIVKDPQQAGSQAIVEKMD